MFKRIGLVVLVIIILVAVVTLTALNSGEVELDLAFFSGTYKVTTILIASFVVGTIFGMHDDQTAVIRPLAAGCLIAGRGDHDGLDAAIANQRIAADLPEEKISAPPASLRPLPRQRCRHIVHPLKAQSLGKTRPPSIGSLAHGGDAVEHRAR